MMSARTFHKFSQLHCICWSKGFSVPQNGRHHAAAICKTSWPHYASSKILFRIGFLLLTRVHGVGFLLLRPSFSVWFELTSVKPAVNNIRWITRARSSGLIRQLYWVHLLHLSRIPALRFAPFLPAGKTPGDAPPKLVCQFCSYSTVYSTTMVRHVRTHTGERPYRCVSCKKGFTTQQQLEKHCSQPLKPCYKPFECNYCSERFPTDTMLTRHQRLHVFSTFWNSGMSSSLFYLHKLDGCLPEIGMKWSHYVSYSWP